MVRNFLLIARLTASSSFTRYKSTHIPLGSLLQLKHTASIFFFNSFTSASSSDSESDGNRHKDGPDAVIDMLSNYGFDKIQVAKLAKKQPLVLLEDAENTLLPKLEFFRSIGVSNTDMPKILIANRDILFRSLEKCLIPRYQILKSVVCDDGEAVTALINAPFDFTNGDMMNHLVPNIKVQRQSNVPPASISLLMVHFTGVAYMKHSKFVEAVNKAREIGCDPSKMVFMHAVRLLLTTSKTLWDSKFEVYERWGWNHEMALRAFVKSPNFMMLSEETYTKKMTFLVKDMGLPSEDIAHYPQVLTYSFEKRIIPRFSVIKILCSKGLLKKDLHFSSFMCLTEENFLKKFVIKFQDDLPLLSDVYKGLFNHQNVV
ncbi:hypothetical protein JHK82_049971 [Glycine max]|uniref:Uncharacterized protein n=1 Tax=Glycine soja TaxID=3848 RepID=A0A445FRU8_GLYSO|nr:hypothetical protein JHK86_049846 [Glycine max]KAG5091193.1 hypothetical protein JHK82_049971 [Glycine max]RZB51615.1 hypothetical protein D0Y65_048155 [Glycine soja]